MALCSVSCMSVAGELGREWYENGRKRQKLNTFFDFNDGVKEIVEKALVLQTRFLQRAAVLGGF